jgi:(R,R)-butanediol dehydrogenase/meso-butanediol dehydrogenase/diacetyl reductase
MKAAFIESPKKFIIQDAPKPVPEANDVIVRVRACSICGSDLTVYKMGIEGRILGHEFSGDIAETGSQVKNWSPGDRVVVEPSIVCGECHWCKQGQYNLCGSLGYTGLATDGGFAEFARVPAYQLHRLPNELNYEQGALIEPLAVALRGVAFSKIEHGDTAVVFGCGSVGLGVMLWARYKGVRKIVAVDVVSARVAAAQKVADIALNSGEVDALTEILKITEDIGPEVVFECSGNMQAQEQAITAIQKGGRIVLLGIGYEPSQLMLSELIMKEISIKGSLGYSSIKGNGEFPEAIQAVKSGAINLQLIPTQTFSLEDIGEAFESVSHGQTAKATILP